MFLRKKGNENKSSHKKEGNKINRIIHGFDRYVWLTIALCTFTDCNFVCNNNRVCCVPNYSYFFVTMTTSTLWTVTSFWQISANRIAVTLRIFRCKIILELFWRKGRKRGNNRFSTPQIGLYLSTFNNQGVFVEMNCFRRTFVGNLWTELSTNSSVAV